MHEPDVALTDFALALECALLAILIRRGAARGSPLQRPFEIFFWSIGASALLGGTVHGFFPEEAHPGRAILWVGTMLGIGLTATAAWAIGARLAGRPGIERWITPAASLAFVGYALAVIGGARDFRIAVLFYFPAVLFLAIVYAIRLFTRRTLPWAIGLAGLLLSFAAAAVQQGRVGVPALHLTHNALYHVLQGVALALIYLSARRLVRDGSDAGEPAPERRC